MAPSRSGTPARDSSPEPDLLLSPRSRMEARLAAMDTSSEDENDEQTPAPVPASRRRPNASGTQTATKPIDVSDESSEEDIRPRGRFAAQMQAKHSPEGSKSPQASKTSRPGEPTEQAARNTTAADSDSEDLPVAPRRMKRKQASATLSSAPQSPAPPPSSPGLFVSPAPALAAPETNDANGAGADEEFPAVKNPRFQALVERKRQERLAREAEEERQREEKRARQADMDDDEEDGNSSSITDDEGGRKLTQEARPTRKAGKKAVEEMNRETQRMARNMQLAHEAKTRKKITKASLFERFNFKTESVAPATAAAAVEASGPEPKTTSSSRPTTPVSATHTDTEMKDAADTPPSSPPLGDQLKSSENKKHSVVEPITRVSDADDDLPTLAEMLGRTSSPKQNMHTNKGKGKAVDVAGEVAAPAAKPKRHFRVKLPQIAVNSVAVGSNDDDELEITTTRKNRLDAIFDRVPEKKAKEASSIHALRLLAQIKSPSKASRKANSSKTSSMTPGELEFTLYQRARQQARMERERRLEMLKAKGVVVQTEEEREREMQDVEDIVSRARKEAEEIMEKEREAAKLEKRRKIQNGELDPMAWDDSEDDEYEGSDEGQEDEPELSGSDDENSAAEDGVSNAMVEDEAAEDADEDADDSDQGAAEEPQRQEPDSDDEVELPRKNIRRQNKKALVISDDEEEEGGAVEATPKPKTTTTTVTTATYKSPPAANTDSPAAPTSVLRSAKKSFIPGLPVAGPAGLGLTQIFAGTMDDSQAQAPASGSVASPMPSFGGFPDFNVSQEDSAHADDSMILDSQGGDTQKVPTLNGEETQGIQLHYTQSQMHGFDSLLRDDEDRVAATQVSMEPSQDGGLADYTPLRERFVEPPVSTAQTVVLDRAVDGEAYADVDGDAGQDSPLVRRGRLRRKMASIAEESLPATATSTVPTAEDVPPTATAFGVMADAAQKEKRSKDKAEYNKKKSKAKDMFQEQAEESEDEYAGLGGADGEDSSDDDAASVKEMIDDEGGQIDEGQIAALHADRERARDEQMVDKLFHDITTGMLRRKRGADYDLSDSDDGGEARRRLKRRQFAKMQKALFADERIKKIAEKPGNQAFLRTIEDQGSDEEMDFLDVGPESMDTDESSSQSQSQLHNREHTVADSQAPANTRNPLTTTTTEGNRQPTNSRRTKDGKRRSNIGEIRDSVSSLLEEPADASVIPGTMVGSDHSDAGEDDDDDNDNDGHDAQHCTEGSTRPAAQANPRRTAGAKPAVIDRMSLKRDSSSTSNLSTSSRLAFAMPSGSGSSFKVPALLRRATTNSLAGPGTTSSGNGSGAGASGRSSFGGEGKIKKTAGKRSGVSALARETERRAAMQENEKRREARKWKGAEKRGRAVGGLFAAGKFE